MPDLRIGSRGTLTIGTRGKDGPGEVQVDEGETFIAYSAEPLPRGTVVVIYDTHGGSARKMWAENGDQPAAKSVGEAGSPRL